MAGITNIKTLSLEIENALNHVPLPKDKVLTVTQTQLVETYTTINSNITPVENQYPETCIH